MTTSNGFGTVGRRFTTQVLQKINELLGYRIREAFVKPYPHPRRPQFLMAPAALGIRLSWCFIMIFSRSAEYAIRGLTCLAPMAPGESTLVKQVASETGIPVHFLAKILQDLVRHGFLKSNKGPRGGFRLTGPASEMQLLRIVEAVDGPRRYQRCIAGNDECHERVLCPLHDSWVPVRRRIVEYLQGTTIADLAKSMGEKRRLLARTRRGAPAK